jgi:FeS assembly SUF system protein
MELEGAAMSESSEPHRQPLPVINSSAKVEQLRADAAKGPPPPKHVDTTIISRFVDANKTPKQKAIEEKVIDALRLVYDPEIPVNIYDLGLIYGIDVDDASGAVKVRMTLTAPACPVAGQIVADVTSRVESIDEVPGADVQLVWDPPWSREMMSEAAQLELGLI